MSRRKVQRVVLTSRELVRFSDSYLAVPSKLFWEIGRLGFEPFVVSPEQIPSEVMSVGPALLVLTGGESLGENLKRDDFEQKLIREAILRQIPILGLCRGTQLLGAYFGATIVQVEGHLASRNIIRSKALGEGPVTCHHSDALGGVPSGFELFAESGDGLVEGIVHEDLAVLGVQWHPERQDDSSRLSAVPVLKHVLRLD